MFVVLPTGISATSYSLPTWFDHLRMVDKKFMVMLVGPLVSLMKGQMSSLSSRGVRARAVGGVLCTWSIYK